MNKKILLIGGGGHCKSVLDSLIKTGEYSDVGIVDNKDIGKTVLGKKIIGSDDDLASLYKEGYAYAFITVGNSGDLLLRKKLFKLIKEIGFIIPYIIDPSASVSGNIEIGEGVFIGKNAIVNAGSFLGECSIINSASLVEHDCKVGSFSHISPGVILCGSVQIGENTHIGAGSIIREQTKIGSQSIVGMGSIVLKNIDDNILAYGNPCKEVKSI